MKQGFDRATALPVARELCQALEPVTSRLIVAGSALGVAVQMWRVTP